MELESDKAATQRMIAPVERFAAEMEESIGKTLSAAERADLRSELQGKQKELLDGVAIDGNPADYDNTLNTLQAVRDAAGDPEKLQELLDRNITIGGEEVITTRSVPVEPVAPERDVVDTTTAEVVPAAPPPPAPRVEVESARTAEHETVELQLALRIAEARGRLELARELVKKARKKVELPDNGFEDLKTIERVRRERELQQAKDQKKAAKKSLKQLESELAGVRQTTEVSATAVPVAAAVESTIPAPEPVAAVQPEAVTEPQVRTEIVVNEELIRERIEALIANRAELDPLEQAASGELDANKVREQMSEMQRALADALSIRVRAPDGLYGLDMEALETLTLEQLMDGINDLHQESLDLQPDIPIVGWPEAENEDPEKMKMVVLARIEARLGPASGEFNSALAAIDTPDSAGFEVINLRLKEIQTELGRFLVRPEEFLLELDAGIRQIKERGLVSDELDMIEGLVNSEKYNEIRSYFEDLPLEQSEGGINSEGLPGSLEEFLQEGIVTADDVNSGEYGAEYQGVDRAYANMLKLLSVTPRAISQDLIWQALRDHFNLTWKTVTEELPIESWKEAMVELRFHTGLDKDKYPGPPSIRPIAVSDLGEFFSEVMFKILENRIASAKAN